MISSKNERVFIRDLSDLTLKIIFDAWWASMNVGSRRPIAWKNCRHAPSWRFYLHCGIQETGSPGIICIVCHQVLRHPSEHWTSSMGKHLLAKAHIAKLNELTESEVTELTSSTADETALAILKRQGSRGITIVSLQRKTIFDIQFNPYWPKWQTKCSKLADKDIETSEFHQDTWNRYLMLGFVSAHIPWNAISNLELWRSYKASVGTPSVSIARWSISRNRSAHTGSCKSWILFNAHLSDLEILTTPKHILSWNWRLVPFEDGWQMGQVQLLSVITGWIWALRLSFRWRLRSSSLMMVISPRSSMIGSNGSPESKWLISFITNSSTPPIAWGTSQQHPTISNLLLPRH